MKIHIGSCKCTSRDELSLLTYRPFLARRFKSDLQIRYAMCAASQLPGKGPTDVDDVQIYPHLHVNQKSD